MAFFKPCKTYRKAKGNREGDKAVNAFGSQAAENIPQTLYKTMAIIRRRPTSDPQALPPNIRPTDKLMTANDTEQHRQTVSKSNPRKIKLHGLDREETFAFKSAHSAGLPAASGFGGKRSAEKKGRTFTKTRKVRKTICKISENSRPNINCP